MLRLVSAIAYKGKWSRERGVSDYLILRSLQKATDTAHTVNITQYIYQKADPTQLVEKHYRFEPRRQDESFFRRYIQDPSGLMASGRNHTS